MSLSSLSQFLPKQETKNIRSHETSEEGRERKEYLTYPYARKYIQLSYSRLHVSYFNLRVFGPGVFNQS
jgi:hypothetical protein